MRILHIFEYLTVRLLCDMDFIHCTHILIVVAWWQKGSKDSKSMKMGNSFHALWKVPLCKNDRKSSYIQAQIELDVLTLNE